MPNPGDATVSAGSLVWQQLFWPQPLTEATAFGLLRHWAAQTHAPQLILEARPDEARRVAKFFARVGLPVHLGHLSIDAGNASDLDTIAGGALGFPFIGNMPMAIDAAVLRKGLLGAHELGLAISADAGDAPYRRLHAG